MKFISLFSGIGGFDLGFDLAGMECAAQVEFDEQASKVLNYWWPNVPQFKDVRHVGKHNLPSVDLICGGFPCQDVSVAGKRGGLAGERSGLWFEFLRIITQLTPQWVIIENVPGLLSSNGGRDFAVILRGLVKCGYRVGYRILDSQHFGVPQRRRRVFIVASLGNGDCAKVLFERESVQGDTQTGRQAGQSVTGYVIKGAAIGRKPENGPQRGEWLQDQSYTLNATEVHAVTVGTLAASGAGTMRPAGQGNELDFLVPTVPDRIHKWKDESDRIRAIRDDGHSSTVQEHVYFKTNSNAIDSLTCARPPKMINGYAVRRLTPTECERLQGFPDGWTAVNGQSDSARYRQLGNAVTVNVAAWLGQRIMDVAGFRLLDMVESETA